MARSTIRGSTSRTATAATEVTAATAATAGYGAYSPYPSEDVRPAPEEGTGSVRLRVKPSNGKVYLDGTFMGVVDQFDGLTDHLAAPVGRHEIEVRADGYDTLTLAVDVEPDKTVTVRGSLPKK